MPEPIIVAPGGAAAEGVRLSNMPIGARLAAASTYDAEARTVEITAATENPVRMPGWQLGIDYEYYLEILDCSLNSVDFSQVAAGNCPLLDSHGRWSLEDRLGVIRTARIENKELITLAAFGQSDKARTVEADVAANTAPKASVGYRREQMIFERMEGEVPVYRVTRWAVTEVTFCPIAADPNAGVRSASASVSPCTIMENRAMPQDNDAAGAADTTIDLVPENGGERSDTHRPAVQPSIARFTGSSALALVDQARAFGDTVVTRAQELIAQNEKGEISQEGARTALLTAIVDAQRTATGGISTGGRPIEVGQDARDKFVAGATNAILLRAGLADMVRAAATLRGEKIDLDPGEFRGIRNVELARMSLERAGQRVDSYDRDVIVGQALALRSGPMQSTSDFPLLLENVMHKTLQAAYLTTPDTWRRFTGVGSVTDFRPHPRYLRGTFGALDDVLEDGEFKNKAIPDAAKESISAKTKGNIVALTRQAIVNDDMSAFSSITVDLARAAKLSVEKDVYALLALNGGLGPLMNDGLPLFDAAHHNIGTAAAPGVTSIDLMRQLMASQTDVSGHEILDIKPAIWLGPLTLGGAVRVTVNSEFDPDTASKLQRFNMVRNIYSDVVDTARLSGTRWYNFADPSVAPAIEVVFLNGNQEPYTEMREGWRVDGTEFKIRHDYGVGALNWRSAATNAGA